MGGLLTSGPSDISQHHARLLTGGGVDVVVAEEDLRGRGAGGAVLGHVVRTDVDGIGGGLFHMVVRRLNTPLTLAWSAVRTEPP